MANLTPEPWEHLKKHGYCTGKTDDPPEATAEQKKAFAWLQNRENAPHATSAGKARLTGGRSAPCARHCEATAFKIEIRRLQSELAGKQAEPVQEPVAEVFVRRDGVAFAFWLHVPPPAGTKLFTTPPQRTIAPAQQDEPVAFDTAHAMRLADEYAEAAHQFHHRVDEVRAKLASYLGIKGGGNG